MRACVCVCVHTLMCVCVCLSVEDEWPEDNSLPRLVDSKSSHWSLVAQHLYHRAFLIGRPQCHCPWNNNNNNGSLLFTMYTCTLGAHSVTIPGTTTNVRTVSRYTECPQRHHPWTIHNSLLFALYTCTFSIHRITIPGATAASPTDLWSDLYLNTLPQSDLGPQYHEG